MANSAVKKSDRSPAADPDRFDAALAARGDHAAFERLYNGHAGRVRALARRMVNVDRADELTQQVFVRVWQKLGTFRGEAQFGSWLHRVAVNTILSERESLGRERSRISDGEDEVFDSFEAPTKSHTIKQVDLEAAIRKLPERAREVFVLHDVEGYKHQEIAGLPGVTTGTSKSQLHRARRMLREFLGQ